MNEANNLEREKFFWEKIDNSKYIRRCIDFYTNLHNYNNVDDIIFKVNSKVVDDYLSEKVLSSPFENIIKCDEKDDDDIIINSDSFKRYYVNLIKCLYAIETLSNNDKFVVLNEIFNLCNVVAFDLKQKFIVILYNRQIYIIFYSKNNGYITLNLRENSLITKDYYIQKEMKEFLCFSNMDYIYEYYKHKTNFDKEELSSSSSSSIFSKIASTFMTIIKYFSSPSLIVSPPLIPSRLLYFPPFNKKAQEEEAFIYKGDSPMFYLDWQWDKETNTYSRYCINFESSLKNIYINEFKKKRNAYYPLEQVCENLLRFNHLYIFHEALIYNNVIHIDFENYSFVILIVFDQHECEVMTVSFLPFYYNGKSSNELTIPFSNFILKFPFNYLYFHEYLPFIGKSREKKM